MSKTKQELLNDTLHEAKQFAKDKKAVDKYLAIVKEL